MRRMIIESAPTISGMFETGMEVSGFVEHQNVRVLIQENGHWELEIAPNMVAELVAALMHLEQIPTIMITDIMNGVL